MKKYLLIIVLFLAAGQGFVAAQGRRGAMRQEMMEKIREAKWAFIIYRLHLDEPRANKLLPVYEAYETEKRAIFRNGVKRALQGRGNEITDEEAEKLMNARLENARKMLELKEKYKDEFLKVLSAGELLELQEAEQDFAVKIQAERQKRRQAGK
jgi:hypothetical protein